MTITFSLEILDISDDWQFPLEIDFAGFWLAKSVISLLLQCFLTLLILVCLNVPYSYFLRFFDHVFLRSLAGAGESYSQLTRFCFLGPIPLGYPALQHFSHEIVILFTYCVIYCECLKTRDCGFFTHFCISRFQQSTQHIVSTQ